MSPLALLLIALALAVDAFAVALATGACLPKVDARQTFRLTWHFGLFQAGMNIIGWAVGLTFRTLIESFDHWLAFALLLAVGGHMIYAALSDHPDQCGPTDPTRGWSLLMLSVATSIDALAVGLSFALLKVAIWVPALIIGLVAALLTGIGLHLGRLLKSAARLGTTIEVGGGLILIAIGLNILHGHGVF
ncbi:MAG: manganese efflux pump [Desulfobulbaceae bacterium]|nr:manganese efflux pump [Desulfobulbaceae bacterium]